jgi:hypothetical protein
LTNINDLNKAVFTTVYVLNRISPIVYVSHDADDDWQFFGPEKNVQIDKARVMSLGEIIEMDPTVKELLNMPIGTEAHRKDIGSEWMRINKS